VAPGNAASAFLRSGCSQQALAISCAIGSSSETPLGAHRFQRPWLPLRSLIEAKQPEAMRTQGRFSLFLNVGTRHEG
jgi:hypothetical protein